MKDLELFFPFGRRLINSAEQWSRMDQNSIAEEKTQKKVVGTAVVGSWVLLEEKSGLILTTWSKAVQNILQRFGIDQNVWKMEKDELNREEQ